MSKPLSIGVVALWVFSAIYYWIHASIQDPEYSPFFTAMFSCGGPALMLALLLWYTPKKVKK